MKYYSDPDILNRTTPRSQRVRARNWVKCKDTKLDMIGNAEHKKNGPVNSLPMTVR